MHRCIRSLSLFSLLLLFACKGESAAKDDTQWPTQPADGTPVVFEFVELVGEGKDVRANMRIFNFTDKTVGSVSMTLHYQDGAGNDLKTFPWSHQSPSGLVGKKGHAILKMGAFLPEHTKKVVAELQAVHFDDQTAWTK